MLWFFSEESYSPSMVNGKKRVGSNSLCQGPITSSIDYQMAKPGPAGRRTNHRRSNQPLQIGKKYIVILYFTKLKGSDHKDFWSIFDQDSESQHLIYCFSYSKWKNKWEPISRIIPLVLLLIWKHPYKILNVKVGWMNSFPILHLYVRWALCTYVLLGLK